MKHKHHKRKSNPWHTICNSAITPIFAKKNGLLLSHTGWGGNRSVYHKRDKLIPRKFISAVWKRD